ncbi:trigger factor [Fangia hongkongensis]|uniref:trigger factor n=1 Tax=Fangia hongkongensis TaxID=270495 RepID=UPI00037729CC|nr:trigger factor [Fangia hongkongensis]MBK2124336.1 trigger factor [Fangia hongkongensis]
MQVSVEKKEGIHCILNVEIPASEVDQEVSKRIKKIAKTARVDGFRPGKVPAGVIKKKYGEQVRFEVLGDVLPAKYAKAIEDEKLNAAGVEVEIVQNEEGKELKFNVDVELFPEIAIEKLDTIEVKKPVVELGEKEHEKMIANLRKQLATWNEVDREVKEEDKVTIDFVGRVDGEVFEGGSADASEVTIGSGQMIPGFEEGIVGMKKDQEKTITVTFPEDYQNEELKGKEAEFDIIVKDIKEASLPEIDAEFVEKFGIKGGEEEFYTEIKQNMARELKAATQRKVKSQVFDGLVKAIEVEVPKALVKREIDRAKNDLLKRMGGANAKLKAEDIPDNIFEEKAKHDVKLGLIINAIVDQQKFEADEASIDAMIEEMASVYEDADEVRTHVKKDKKEFDNIKAVVIENKLVDWVCDQAKVEDEKEDFFDLIRNTMPQQPMM